MCYLLLYYQFQQTRQPQATPTHHLIVSEGQKLSEAPSEALWQAVHGAEIKVPARG